MLLQKGVGHRGYWLATFAISAGGGQWWAGIPSKATVSTLDVTSSSKNSRPGTPSTHQLCAKSRTESCEKGVYV